VVRSPVTLWPATAARCLLGAVLVVAGALELPDPAAAERAVRAYRLLPEALVGPVAFGLPVVEIAVGLVLLAGVLVRTAALASAALLVVYLVGVGSAWARGLQIDCGCFGGGGQVAAGRTAYPAAVARDVALLAVALALARWPRSRLALGHGLPVPPVVGGSVAAALLAVAVVAGVGVQSARVPSAAAAPVAAPAHTSGDGYTVVVGQASAPVTVDLYEDFQCPVCRRFESTDAGTLASLVRAGTVQLHYHPMAFLDTSANGRYSTRALDAAAAVLTAAGPDGFQRFHDLLYADQPPEGGSGLSDEQLVQLAAQAGASGPAVEQAVRNVSYGGWAAAATDRASRDGVTATPTVLVGGVPLADRSVAGLTAAVRAVQGG
jgi:protein-disulfide isomerase